MLLSMAILVLFARPILSSGQRRIPLTRCIANLKQQSSALQQYAMDYEDHLPETKWVDRLTVVYLKSRVAFHCPVQDKSGFGYAFNAKLLGKSLEQLVEPERVVLLFETTNREENALSTNGPFSTRHNGYGYVCFADGYIESVNRTRFNELIALKPRWKDTDPKKP